VSSFLPPKRGRQLLALADRAFDLLVIGGGITGAGIARDAARRGLVVALVERDDFAAGTSSRSSRLIHGGVRYLEHGYLHLVFEASRERRRLLELAPHLVWPLRFTWPVYKGARVPRWKLLAGLTMYDMLSLFRNVGRHQMLGARGVRDFEPALGMEGLKGGASYWDAATDDARLTLANVLDASEHSATVLNHVEVTALTFGANGLAEGAMLRDRRGGLEVPVKARLIVNATGPWTDSITRLEEPTSTSTLRGTKGVHIAVSSERVGNFGAVTMLSPDDGRVMFTLPAGRFTIIGTTDTPTEEDPEQVRASRADVRYLLHACNRFFPAAQLTEDDVIAAWAGIRPLAAQKRGRTPSSASREHLITFTPAGVLAITGGKLTTYREMAEQCVDAAVRRLGMKVRPCDTTTARLPGQRPPASPDDVLLAPPLEWREADVTQAVRSEFAETVADVLMRRTHLAFEMKDHGVGVSRQVATMMGTLLGWTGAGVDTAVTEYAREAARIFKVND
jgi:glycerol-3-phosphate dehydrogenase